ncbi:MAG: methionyl-tRNA formyltransferase [Actinobacteria bacterium]|nr:methionyl-tRNA formyltransferase [Actinomycetota bacterium]
MRLAVAATPSLACATLEWIQASEHELTLVITRPDKPAGRGKVLQQSEVAEWAAQNSVPVVKPVRSLELIPWLGDVDLVVTLAYGVILPENVLQVPRYGFVNMHFSLLPAWRGAAPVQRGIENGDKVSGVTVFQLDVGMDTGPIFVQDSVEIDPNENSGELLTRLAIGAPASLAKALTMIERGNSPIAQKLEGQSTAKKISKAEARINWHQEAKSVSRKIRAFTPEPGAWAQWKGARIQILRAEPISLAEPLAPGHISSANGELLVGCGEMTALRIDEIAPAGKRTMKANQWLNGARCQLGDFFD